MIIATSRISMTEITETCGHGVENCVTHGPFQSNIRLAPKTHCNPVFKDARLGRVNGFWVGSFSKRLMAASGLTRWLGIRLRLRRSPQFHTLAIPQPVTLWTAPLLLGHQASAGSCRHT